jgi:hypothetical protein
MTFIEKPLALARCLEPWIGELALDLPIVLEIRERRRVTDERDDERPAEGRFA